MTPPAAPPRHRRCVLTPTEMLEHDRGVERRLLWKGVLALLIVVLVVVVRQHYLL
jgi:hypothetical protein